MKIENNDKEDARHPGNSDAGIFFVRQIREETLKGSNLNGEVAVRCAKFASELKTYRFFSIKPKLWQENVFFEEVYRIRLILQQLSKRWTK